MYMLAELLLGRQVGTFVPASAMFCPPLQIILMQDYRILPFCPPYVRLLPTLTHVHVCKTLRALAPSYKILKEALVGMGL